MGNLALGRSAEFLFLLEIFLSISPFLFSIRPAVLAETITPSRFRIAASLCFDQVGYCSRSSTTLAAMGHEVVGCLYQFGFLEYSFKPIIPKFSNLFNQRYKVIRPIPKCLAVSEQLSPRALCQSNILILYFALSVNLSVRNAERAIDAVPGSIEP